jgi:hypothetical protein
MRRKFIVPILALGVAGWALTRLAPLHAQSAASALPKDTILESNSNSNDDSGNPIWKLTPGQPPQLFARVDRGTDPGNGEWPWLCPIGVGPNGHLYVVSVADSGTLWDATAGGDVIPSRVATVKPVATSIFTDQPNKMCGIAFDGASNIYLTSSENGAQPIMKVTPAGKVSPLKGTYNLPRGLAVKKDASNNEILYIVQAGDATIQTYNLTTDTPGTSAFAKGFPQQDNHTPGSIVVNHQGQILVLWRLDPSDANNAFDSNSGAVFDITAGGDFSDLTKTPPLVHTQFRMDVNEMAVDSQNNLYIAGNDSRTCWMSPFNGGKYGPCVAFSGFGANQANLGDSEAVAVAP